ncbi:MAG: FAD-dependent oxidoreductase [Desulfobacteraceae bacterium]|nr:FAD-dependent oxidoreductase [Desulfobacteraceae bacterium]
MDTKLTILGAGPGGYVAAIKAASKGIKVTLIEKENLGVHAEIMSEVALKAIGNSIHG